MSLDTEQAGGISPPASHRTVREPVDSHGSFQPSICLLREQSDAEGRGSSWFPVDSPTTKGMNSRPSFAFWRDTGSKSQYPTNSSVRMSFSDRKCTGLNSSHANMSYAVFCL